MKARNIQTRAGGKHWLSNTRGNYQQKEQMETKKSCNEDTHPEMGWTTWGYNKSKENLARRRYAWHAFFLFFWSK